MRSGGRRPTWPVGARQGDVYAAVYLCQQHDFTTVRELIDYLYKESISSGPSYQLFDALADAVVIYLELTAIEAQELMLLAA